MVRFRDRRIYDYQNHVWMGRVSDRTGPVMQKPPISTEKYSVTHQPSDRPSEQLAHRVKSRVHTVEENTEAMSMGYLEDIHDPFLSMV